MAAAGIIIEEYNPAWVWEFQKLKKVYEKHLTGLITDVRHVGSTSVEGLAAKPVIDIDIIIESPEMLPPVSEKLKALGYEYAGDLGIKDREAFRRISDNTPLDGSGANWMRHNLYVCPVYSVSLRNHLTLRDHLRSHPETAKQYGELKKALALQCAGNMDMYVEGKTGFIIEILRTAGFNSEELGEITEQNKAPRT